MAIDSRDKRFALILLDLPGRVLPTPDGVIDSGDRMHLAGKYRGLSEAAALHFYKQMHHRLGQYHTTAESDVPQKRMQIG